MDPLSITASAIALAASVLRAALFVKDAVDQFQDAPAFARDIQDEINIVQAALLQVEAILQRDQQVIWRFRLQDVFELSVKGCRDTLDLINEELKGLFGRQDWKASFELWWTAGEVRRLLGRLETKKGSLMLLVQALNLHSMQEMQELLQQNMATLDLARFGLDNMVHSYPAYTAGELDSVVSAIGSDDSVLGDRESVVSNTRFVFDTVCFDSKAYRHTVARVSAKKKRESKQTKGTSVASMADPPSLPTVKETESDGETSTQTALPAPPAGVTSEEHEAVLIKLREAEALIRTLQEQMQRSAALVADQEAASPNQGPARVTEMEEETKPSKDMVPEKATSSATESIGKSSKSTHTSYSIPYDGTPITINPSIKAAPRANSSQTSLLIEYFEGTKVPENGNQRKPAVKVRITSKKDRRPRNQSTGFISIPTTRDRPPSEQKKRASSSSAYGKQTASEPLAADSTNETVISSIPPCSFLDETDIEERPLPSEISSIPTCSFLDGTEPPSILSRQDANKPAPDLVQQPTRRRERNGGLGKRMQLDPTAAKPMAVKSAATEPTENVVRDSSKTPGDVRQPRNSSTTLSPTLLEAVEDAIRKIVLPDLKQPERKKIQRRSEITRSRVAGNQGSGTAQEVRRAPLKDTTNLERGRIDPDKTADAAFLKIASPEPVSAEEARLNNLGATRMSVDACLAKSSDEDDKLSRAPAAPSSSAQRDGILISDIDSLNTIGVDEKTGKTIQHAAPPPCLDPSRVRPLDTCISPRVTTPGPADIIIGSGDKRKKIEITVLPPHPAQCLGDLESIRKLNDGLEGINKTPERGNKPFRMDTKRVIAEINRNTEDLFRDSPLRQPFQAEVDEEAAKREPRFRRSLKALAQSKSSNDLASIEDSLARLLDEFDGIKKQTQARESRVVGTA